MSAVKPKLDSQFIPISVVEAEPELLAAAKAMLDCINDLTSEEYSRGGDKQARERLAAAVAAAEGIKVPR